MYELHIANKNYSSWSLRIWILMRELGIPFHETMHFLGSSQQNSRFRDFSPNAKVPCLVDGKTILWDSLAITEYLAEDYPQVWPQDKIARAFARCAASEMHSSFQALRNECSLSVGVRVAMNGISLGLQADLDRIDELWQQGLSRFGGPFLAGTAFSAVDAFYAPIAYRLQTFGLALSPVSNAYVTRLRALSGMQEWYRSALEETEREADHDADILKAGRIVEDFRSIGREIY